MIEYQDFAKVDIRAGKIVRAEDFVRARNPAYKVWVDFGQQIGIKKTSAQIKTNYQLEELIGRTVLGVVNLSPRNIAGFISEFLILGLPDDNGRVHLITYEPSTLVGTRLC